MRQNDNHFIWNYLSAWEIYFPFCLIQLNSSWDGLFNQSFIGTCRFHKLFDVTANTVENSVQAFSLCSSGWLFSQRKWMARDFFFLSRWCSGPRFSTPCLRAVNIFFSFCPLWLFRESGLSGVVLCSFLVRTVEGGAAFKSRHGRCDCRRRYEASNSPCHCRRILTLESGLVSVCVAWYSSGNSGFVSGRFKHAMWCSVETVIPLEFPLQ